MRRVGIQTAPPPTPPAAEHVVAEVSRLVEKLVLAERDMCAAVAEDTPLECQCQCAGGFAIADAIRARSKEKTNG